MNNSFFVILLSVFGLSFLAGSSSVVAGVSQKTQNQQIANVSFSDAFIAAQESLKKWANNDADVLDQFGKLVDSLKNGISKGAISEKDAAVVLRAVSFAAEKHKLQVRKNAQKTPYVIHPLGVADQVIRIGQVYNKDVLVAALLHDTLEDTVTTPGEIESYFGKTVAQYVVDMTDDKRLSSKERKKQQIIRALHQSKEVAIIKFSDKLHNLNTLMRDPPEGWTQDRMDQYFQWAQAVVDNLPSVNDSLKDAVHNSIVKYWDMQNK